MRKVLVLALLIGAVAAWNAGCSGGDDDDDGHTPPDSVTISGSVPASTFREYMGRQAR